MPMPNKTIYVADSDLSLYQRAQELAGGSLSSAISVALRRYVDMEEGRREGFEEITVKVGTGKSKRKQRFSGVLLGEWGQTVGQRVDVYRVYRTRSHRFAIYLDRSDEWTNDSGSASDNWIRDLNWRTLLGVGEQRDTSWGFVRGESTLVVVDSLAELRAAIPAEFYDLVATAAEQPPIEDLDI